QVFEDLPLEHDILSFIKDLGHTRDITYLTDVNIENKDAKKTNKMSYPRFTKIIIDYFMSKDQSISGRNKMSWHTARDDSMFTSMRCISRHEDTHVYGSILPTELTNQEMLEPKAYQTYYAFAYGEETTSKEDKSQRFNYIIQGDGVDTQSKVPDEQQHKTSGIDEETGDSEDEDDNDDDGDNDENDQTEYEEEDIDDRVRTSSDYKLMDEEKLDGEETMDDQEDDEVIKVMYEDVNVNLGNDDTEMTDADQGASEQQNVSQESGFEQEEEDAHVTLTPFLDTQKANEPVQSSLVSSDFTISKLSL
ncbi:hypothetical protein Tco_1295196, partial [Tanacetum coccineum]